MALDSLQKKLEFTEEVKKCKSLQEIFDTTKKYYDTHEQIGSIAKGLLIQQLPKILTVCNLKLKK